MLKKLKISHKQMIVSSLLGLGILFIVSYIGYSTAKRSMQAEVYNKLNAVRAIKKAQILEFFEENFRDIRVLAQGSDILALFQQLAEYHKSTNAGPGEAFDISTPEFWELGLKQYARFVDELEELVE